MINFAAVAVHAQSFISQSRLYNKRRDWYPTKMFPRRTLDISGQNTSVGSLGNCYSLRYAGQEIYGRVLSICDISRTVYISSAWKQVHVSGRYNKSDKIFNFVSQCRDQISKICQLESRWSKINPFSFLLLIAKSD